MEKIISFDLDGTLADLNFEKAVWLEEIPKLFAKKNNLTIEEAKRAVFSAYEMIGNRDAKWYDIKFWFGELGIGNEYDKLLEESSHLIKLYPETVPVLENLSKRFQLIVISNATRDFIQFKLKVENLEKYFSHIFSTTSDFKCIKGDCKGYLEVCKSLNIKPSELIHIGDDYEFDYLAGREVGIDVYFLNREGKDAKVEKGKEVRDLKEFEKIISSTY